MATGTVTIQRRVGIAGGLTMIVGKITSPGSGTDTTIVGTIDGVNLGDCVVAKANESGAAALEGNAAGVIAAITAANTLTLTHASVTHASHSFNFTIFASK